MSLHIWDQNSTNDFCVSQEHTFIVAGAPIVPLLTGKETVTAIGSGALVNGVGRCIGPLQCTYPAVHENHRAKVRIEGVSQLEVAAVSMCQGHSTLRSHVLDGVLRLAIPNRDFPVGCS